MGRKKRCNRWKGDDNEYDEDLQETKKQNYDDAVASSSPTTNFKDLDFARRRELQRQQAAEKRRAKMKCYICGKAGHVRRECPGLQDDGRGMSRYKGKSDVKHEKEKHQANKLQKKHQQQRSGYYNVSEDRNVENHQPLVNYPEGFGDEGLDFLYYDVSCDIGASLDYVKHGRGKKKIFQKEAFQEYQQALWCAEYYTNFGGMISKALLKPNRPWIPPTTSPLPEKTWYQLGLARDYLYNDSETDAAINALQETVTANKDLVIGLWTVLDYSTSYQARPGCDQESQLRRAKATFSAAAQLEVTVQLQLFPGAASLEEHEGSIAGTDYANVLLGLQALLTETIRLHPKLKVVLSNWSGLSKHMWTFLEGFPKDNLVIGLDGAVSFGKASILHECAFDVPLERLVIATGTAIPAEIANALGRDAFYHSGLWPFVAKAVAHYKKNVSAMEVARKTSELSLKLYPQLTKSDRGIAAHDKQDVEADKTKQTSQDGK